VLFAQLVVQALGHGLGVLAVGNNAHPAILSLWGLSDLSSVTKVRSRFAATGERRSIEMLERMLMEDLDRRIAEAVNETEQARAEARAWETRANQARIEARSWEARAKDNANAREQMVDCIASARRDVYDANLRVEQMMIELANVKRERDVVLSSTTWRVTSPLRMLGHRLPPQLRRVLRGAAKIGWWALTLKLPRKLRERRMALPSCPAPSKEPGVAAWPATKHHGDAFLTVPFSYPVEPLWPLPRIVVMLHLYDNLDHLPRIKQALSNIRLPFSLIVSTDAAEKKAEIEKFFIDWQEGTIRVIENNGRDVAPRLGAFCDIYPRFDYVLQIDIKKSLRTLEGMGELEQIFNDLLGSEEIVSSIFEAFGRNPRLGVVAPRYFPDAEPIGWGVSYDLCAHLAQGLGFELKPEDPVEFPAGSIFWARTRALKPLLDLARESRGFEPGRCEDDATAGHAVGRMICYCAQLAGYQCCFVGNGEDSSETGRASSPDDLVERLRMLDRSPLAPRVRQRLGGHGGESAEQTVALKQRLREAWAKELIAFLASDQRIRLKTSEMPEVSIIIVLHNSAELTLEHLKSLKPALAKVLCELIIIDNASSDRTHELLRRIDGARIILNDCNLHFLRAVNQGAREVRGNHVLLLNNDTRIKSDSIAIAKQILEENEDVGAVGGKLILLDGTLQEAGSIIWDDGACLGYGRGRNPFETEFEFRRDVDYCSGAFLMLRRKLCERLGWLDERYAPAYYEETDLCMRIRAAGYRIVYEPTVEISHFEFGSAESSEEALALQARNFEIFKSVHYTALQERHYPRGTPLLKARSASHEPRILIIDDRIPFSHLGAGYPRAAELIRAMRTQGWEISFYPLIYPGVDMAAARAVFPAEMEIVADHGEYGLNSFLRERDGLYDAVLISRPRNMDIFRNACPPGYVQRTNIIYDAEALLIEREVLRRKVLGTPLSDTTYREELAKEIALTRGARAVTTVSEREAALFQRETDAKVHVIGHRLTAQPTGTPFKQRKDVLFVGALNGRRETAPNIDGLLWFVERVMPVLDGKMGDYQLLVAGRIESDDVEGLANDRVKLLGMVDDLETLYAGCRIFIAPTRFAAGIPLKVLEASARGLPTIGTSVVSSQLGRTHGNDILVADEPAAFANCCWRLYEDAALWERIRIASLESVGRECSPERFDASLKALLCDIRRDPIAKKRAS
jgi:GT2 family glycosyltransferase